MSDRYRDWDDEIEFDERRGLWNEWQSERWRRILDDDAARERRLLADDERRGWSVFESDGFDDPGDPSMRGDADV